ncbi:MAG: hypothetical protein Q9Q40_08235 [Acidobacteriota bacterium]|nr:hypothetical protein [Acidobacteriota bacterium]
MRIPWRSTSLLLCALAPISCGGDRSAVSDRPAEASATHRVAAPAEIAGLHLDDGAKWKMDPHTRFVFGEMARSFLGSAPLSQDSEALKRAGSELQVSINKLIQGCTMTGPAHDQLHKFLTAYMPAVAALAGRGRLEDARKVKRYLEIYGDFFE